MKFVHSFSTRSAALRMYNVGNLRRLLGNVVFYATSVAYLKRLEQRVVLHTDTLGKALLGFLPYDEIYLTAEEIPATVSPRFWAAPKIWALECEPAGAVHIDGDVFIKRQEIIDRIANEHWDVLVQNRENAEWYGDDCPIFRTDADFCNTHGLDVERDGAYNTGVLAFSSNELKNYFVNGYKALAARFSRENITDNMTPDLFSEQKLLYCLTQDSDANVMRLLCSEDIHEEASALGYQHVMTAKKYSQIERCLSVLEIISPEIHQQTKKLCQSILPQ